MHAAVVGVVLGGSRMRAAEQGSVARRSLAGAVVLIAPLVAFSLPVPALADGAFPDSQIILTPAGQLVSRAAGIVPSTKGTL